jgi:hypothetical protein
MKNHFLTRFIAGLFALLATSLFCGIGILLVGTSQSILSLIFATIIIATGFFLGYKIYRTALSRGIISFMTSVIASPDLDNLEPSVNSNHKKYDILQFISAFQKKENLFPKGTRLRVWGNYKFPGFNSYHEIESVQSPDKNLLEISFRDEKSLKIWNPQYILEGKSYFKIVNCDKVEWKDTNTSDDKPVTALFELKNNHIKVATQPNIPVSKDSFQPGEPAVILL